MLHAVEVVNYLRFGGVEGYDDFVCLGWSNIYYIYVYMGFQN